MTRNPRWWPTQQHAEANMQPGDTLKVIGRTFIVCPKGTGIDAVLAACQRTAEATA